MTGNDKVFVSDAVFLTFLLLLGIGLTVYSFHAPWAEPPTSGQEILPRVAAMALTIGAAVCLTNALAMRSAPQPIKSNARGALLPAIYALLYIYALTTLGLVVSTVLFLFLGFTMAGVPGLLRRGVLSAVIAVLFFAFFSVALAIYIPNSILF